MEMIGHDPDALHAEKNFPGGFQSRSGFLRQHNNPLLLPGFEPRLHGYAASGRIACLASLLALTGIFLGSWQMYTSF
jgi:hypothetical protein